VQKRQTGFRPGEKLDHVETLVDSDTGGAGFEHLNPPDTDIHRR